MPNIMRCICVNIRLNIFCMYCFIFRFTYLNTCNIYIATYKIYVCEMHNLSAKCMFIYLYNIYGKYIQEIFSPIFQHIFISMWPFAPFWAIYPHSCSEL